MNNLRTLLQDADPCRHEHPGLDSERERLRLTILQAARIGQANAPPRRRAPFVATIALAAIGAAVLAYTILVPGTVSVSAAVRFEVRLAEARAIPGMVVAQVAGSDRLIYLHPEVVVSNEDIARSWVVDDGSGRFGVAVELLPSGAERMRQATEAHLNRPAAILIDGRVVMTPVVRSPIGDSGIISGGFTRTEAERIVEGIRTR